MKQSTYFLKTSKTAPSDETAINARLLEQAGFVNKAFAGVYSYLPLGLRVLTKIENIIREEMNAIGASEVLMPALQPKVNWEKTGRWETLDVLFRIKSVHDYEIALGPTHEEIVTPLAARWITSYKDLPQSVYQIQTKFRDEPRAKSGLLRGREFRMKDLYSFHTTEEDFQKFYELAAQAYIKVFNRLGLNSIFTEASGGSFSKFSHEFQVEVDSGEDTIYICSNCGLAKNKEVWTGDAEVECTNNCGMKLASGYRETKACEVGNIFPLKIKFSEALGLKYKANDGTEHPAIMGCYGIGSSRSMGVIVEKFHDEKGIIWPKSVAPFQIHLIQLGKEESIQKATELYESLLKQGIEVLFDDRDAAAGEKFADSDLIGIPVRIVISDKTLKENSVEIKKRNEEKSELVPMDGLEKYLKNI